MMELPAMTEFKKVKRVKFLWNDSLTLLQDDINEFLATIDSEATVSLSDAAPGVTTAIIEYWILKRKETKLEPKKIRFKNASIVFDKGDIAPIHFSDRELQLFYQGYTTWKNRECKKH